MGFYLRKGFNFGPLRLNLSRSGLGLSAGVKGFRVGLGPRGAYLHAGRGGLYYRQNLGRLGAAPTPGGGPSPLRPQLGDVQLSEIETAGTDQLANATSSELLAELNRVARRTDLAPLTAFLVVGAAVALGFLVHPFAAIPAIVVGVPVILWVRHLDVTHGTAVLEYDLQGEAAQRYEQLREAFKRLAQCARIWRIDAAGQTDDWKRHAGAGTVVKRSLALPYFGLPRRVQTNIEVPVLPAGNQRLYFYPDQVFVFEGSRVGAVAYADLRAITSTSEFREDEQVPSDAQVVGSTWRYVNKKGGPDRRFGDNREIPIVRYGGLELTSGGGMRLWYQCSQQDAPKIIADAVDQMRA